MSRRKAFTKTSRTPDMTEGPIFTKILVFIIPLIITNLLQVLYNSADMVIVSRSSEGDAVGAIGMTGPFINLVVNIFIGFATGATVVVARHIGASDEENASRSTHTALSMGLIFGAVSIAVGLLISRPVLSLMGAEGKLLELATRYTVIYFAGAPFLAATNYLIAIFRAKGDTRTPLFILSLSGIVNVLLNLFFVLAVHLSVEGVAIATAIANAVSAVCLAWKLSHADDACRLSLRKLRIDKRAFRDILYIGLPAGIQGSLFSISNMTIQSSILSVNNAICPPGAAFAPVVRGSSAMGNLEGFTYTAQNAVAQAAVTFTSQHMGAKKYKRIYRVMGNCYLLGILVSVLVTGVIYIGIDPLLALYNVTDAAKGTLEHIAYESAMLRFMLVNALYFIIPLMEIGSFVVRGLGKSISSTVITLVGACVFRLVWISTAFRFVFEATKNTEPMKALATVFLSFPISWLLTGVVFLIYALYVLKKYIKQDQKASLLAEI